MNTPSSAMTESPLERQRIMPAAISATRPFYWSLRREFWEIRSIYIAPLAAAALILFGFLISALAHRKRLMVDEPYDFAAGMLMLTQILVGFFYSLEALHGERRDRSILFWKSLPVSDLTTVFSKATIPIVIVPLLTWAVTAITMIVMWLLNAAVVAAYGMNAAALCTRLSLFQMCLMLLYHLVTVHSLWHAPFYGWLLMVSAWARRAVFLWAFLPPLAICALEKIVFNSSHFGALLMYRLTGGPEAMAMATGSMPINPGTHLTPGRFLTTPGLWIGLAITAAFLIAAVRLRRYRGPI